MTKISEMTYEELKDYVSKQDSSILFSDLEDVIQFDIAKLPVGYMFPRHYNVLKSEIRKRLMEGEDMSSNEVINLSEAEFVRKYINLSADAQSILKDVMEKLENGYGIDYVEKIIQNKKLQG